MKRTLCAIVVVVLCLITLFVGAELETDVVVEDEPITVSSDYDWDRFADKGITLNVYNWGLNIADGTNGSVDVVSEFEKLTGINVNYTTYDTNESLYAKLKSGGASYDVIVPSDYMIGKMISEGMLEKLNYDNIPNIKKIGQQYRSLPYDPQNEYSVPYTWGVVGLVYNKTMVEETPDSWDALWDPRYEKSILMFNNSRDAFAIAARRMGKSLNPKSIGDVTQIAKELKKQKSVVQAWVMDEIYDKMEGGEAALAPYYAGDAQIMIGENPDLDFVIPKEGTNYFVDAMCIPAGSQHKEAAEMFINFMCETSVGLANTEFTNYSTPLTPVWESLDEEKRNSPIAYPSAEVLENTEVFEVLDPEVNTAMDRAWSDIKSYSEQGNGWIMLAFLLLAMVLIIWNFWRRNLKTRRDNY